MARQAPETAEAEQKQRQRQRQHVANVEKLMRLARKSMLRFSVSFFSAFSLYSCASVCVCVWVKVLEEQCLSSSERERAGEKERERESESEQGLPQS